MDKVLLFSWAILHHCQQTLEGRFSASLQPPGKSPVEHLGRQNPPVTSRGAVQSIECRIVVSRLVAGHEVTLCSKKHCYHRCPFASACHTLHLAYRWAAVVIAHLVHLPQLLVSTPVEWDVPRPWVDIRLREAIAGQTTLDW